LCDIMPTLEVSDETYGKILEDMEKEKKSKDESLEKFSGRWKDLSADEVEEMKKRIREMRDESAGRVA